MTGDTITREELAAFCERLVRDQGAYLSADKIWEDIQAHREPEYEPGGIYQDPAGRTWCRMRRDGGWRCCESGTCYADDVPDRPLRRLAPEPGLDLWKQATDILAGYMDPSSAREAASRICELTRGGSS